MHKKSHLRSEKELEEEAEEGEFADANKPQKTKEEKEILAARGEAEEVRNHTIKASISLNQVV